MSGWILFVYLSTYHAAGGISVTSAVFASQTTCETAADNIKKNWKTFFTQEPKTLCVHQ